MKILYLCADRGIPIRGHKGAAVHVRTMSAAFARAGHAVTILTPRPGPDDGPVPHAEIIHVPLPPSPAGIQDKALARDRRSQSYNDVLIKAAQVLLVKERFDAIYERYSLWSNVGARLAQNTGLPLILEVNAPLATEAARYRHLSDETLALQIESEQFQNATHIAVVSESLKAYVTSRDVPPSRVHVLPNAVDPALFYPAVRGGSVRGRYGLDDLTIVGFVGRPRPWHDLETLLKAFSRLRETDGRYHLLLVGDMPEELVDNLLESDIQDAVTLTGAVPHDEVPHYIAAMDVAVSPHPELDDFYFSPLKLYEYLACGAPTVAADVGQPAQVIQHGETGYLYPPGDAEALAECVRSLVTDPAHRREVAWKGAAKVLENNTWDKNAATVISWLQQNSQTELLPEMASVTLPILDGKLRQRLYRATRPDIGGPLIARRLPMFGKSGSLRFKNIIDIEVFKYKPRRRCVLGYTIHGRSRRDSKSRRFQVIGKVFRDDRGLRLHHIHKILRYLGFSDDATDGITIPDSLAYVPEMRMQVQAHVAGQTLNELVAQENISPYVTLAAQGLAKLHNLPLPLSTNGQELVAMRSYLLGDELKNLDRFTTNLTGMRPQLSPQAHRLRDVLNSMADQLSPLPAVAPIHRDFYYSQVLFHAGKLNLIDFDLFALGDPAIDVANFTAHLYFLGLHKLGHADALADEVDRFLDAYTRFCSVDQDFLARLAFYQAATFFRLLQVVAPRPSLAYLFDDLMHLTTGSLEAV